MRPQQIIFLPLPRTRSAAKTFALKDELPDPPATHALRRVNTKALPRGDWVGTIS
jgi:hypothetical protein